MDFFDNVNSFADVSNRLEEKKKELNKSYNKSVFFIIGLLFLIAAPISYSIAQTEFTFLSALPLIVFVLLSLITIGVKSTILQRNVRDRFLNPEIYKLYNYYENTNFIYNGNIKNDNSFNNPLSLYTRGASASIGYNVTQTDNETLNYSFMDVTLSVSTGQSTAIVFDGIYMTVNLQTDRFFHLKGKRSKTNPKGIKLFYTKHPEYHVYLTAEDYDPKEHVVLRKLDQKYFNIAEFTKKVFDTKHIDIGSDKKTLVIGINKKLNRKTPKSFSQEDIKTYYEEYISNLRKIQSVVDYIYGLNS